MNDIQEITYYQTKDGKKHITKESALYHSKILKKYENANKLIVDGEAIYYALLSIDFPDIDPVYYKITKNDKLIIPIFNNITIPFYSIKKIENENFYVYGSYDNHESGGGFINPIDLAYFINKEL